MELGQDKIVSELISRLDAARGEGVVKVEGTWGSFAHLLAAHISKEVKRPILYVCPHIDDADKAADDMQTFGAARVEPLPAWEGEEDLADATDEIRAERLKIVSRVSSPGSRSDNAGLIIPASIQALCQPVPKPEALEKSRLRLKAGETIPPNNVLGWLADNNFERVDRIDLPGQFAQRGGIVDIYAPLAMEKVLADKKTGPSSDGAEAIRVEFFGDVIESIRQIDLDTHRSSTELQAIAIAPAVCGGGEEERELFANILPADSIVILDEPNDIEEVAKVFFARVEDSSRLYSWEQIYAAMQKFTQLHVCRFATSGPEDFLKVDVKSVQQFQHKATSLWAGHKAALEELVKEAKRGRKVLLYCESPAEISRVKEIAEQSEKKLPANFRLLHGFVHQGFVIDS
ncbi:MAG: hypothetical protein ACYSUV_12735, partial [Planctomycetota bacterium]